MLKRRNPNAAFEADAGATEAVVSRPAPLEQQAAPAPAPAPVAATATAAAAVTPVTPLVDRSATAEVRGQPSVQSTALVRRNIPQGAVSTRVGKIENALDNLYRAFEVDYDTFERLKSGAGCIVDGDNNNLGNQIALTVLSWQDTYDVSPGSDAPEAKKVVKFSDDGQTIIGTGESVTEYLQRLRNGDVDGVKYPNASMKKKGVIVGILEGAAKDTNLLGRTVQVSMSEQSFKTFHRHRFDVTMMVQMGKRASTAGAECLLITAEPKSSQGRNYTLLIVDSDKEAAAEALKHQAT